MSERAAGPSRRRFLQGASLASLGLLAGCGRPPWQAQSQPRVPRIGLLSSGSAADPSAEPAYRRELTDLGYVEGRDIVIERRYAEGQRASLPVLAAELVSLPVDLIVTLGVGTAEAAHAATSTIPIVIVSPDDPVANGLVASLARPGGNVTGVTLFLAHLGGKRLELLKDSVPGLTRVGFIRDPDIESVRPPPGLPDAQAVAQAAGLELVRLDAQQPADLDAAFERALAAGVEAILWGGGLNSRNLESRSRVIAFATQYRLPAMYPYPDFVRAGGLMSYAADLAASSRRVAWYVDRILKGAKPADLPVEQPTTFELVINMQTAKTLGLTIPYHVLLQATEVIE